MNIISIPLRESIQLPLLKAIFDSGGSLKTNEAIEKVEKYFQKLTAEDKASRLESGGNRWINRVQWARQDLVMRGELDSPDRGVWRITDKGKSFLEKEWPKWKEEYSGRDFTKEPSKKSGILKKLTGSPREELEDKYNSIIESVKEEIVNRIIVISPSLFESLVAELLEGLGYGSQKENTIKITGRSGDGGVDGVCSLDLLGLNKILFQAKRWTQSVGPEVVRGFIGALENHRVDRGVIVCTSTFSKAAKEEASKSARVKLIDGKELASWMIRCGLGVKKSKLDIPTIDEDYFSGLT